MNIDEIMDKLEKNRAEDEIKYSKIINEEKLLLIDGQLYQKKDRNLKRYSKKTIRYIAVHRLAFFIHYKLITDVVFHIDGNLKNNHIDNLVGFNARYDWEGKHFWDPVKQKYVAFSSYKNRHFKNSIQFFLGWFDTVDDAGNAYIVFRDILKDYRICKEVCPANDACYLLAGGLFCYSCTKLDIKALIASKELPFYNEIKIEKPKRLFKLKNIVRTEEEQLKLYIGKHIDFIAESLKRTSRTVRRLVAKYPKDFKIKENILQKVS